MFTSSAGPFLPAEQRTCPIATQRAMSVPHVLLSRKKTWLLVEQGDEYVCEQEDILVVQREACVPVAEEDLSVCRAGGDVFCLIGGY